MIKIFLKSVATLLIELIISGSKNKTNEKPVINWVEIPAGTFYMGSDESVAELPNDETLHRVQMKPFKKSKYEITFAQYDAFCDATGRQKPDDEGWVAVTDR